MANHSYVQYCTGADPQENLRLVYMQDDNVWLLRKTADGREWQAGYYMSEGDAVIAYWAGLAEWHSILDNKEAKND